MIFITDKLKRVLGFVFCSVWLGFTVAFFAMITSAGKANMELEIGPFISLKDNAAVLFTRSLIGAGLLMLVFFIWRRRLGFILAFVWSLWWAAVLSTALLNTAGFSDLLSSLVVIFLFLLSAGYSRNRWKKH